MGGRRSL